MNGNPLAMFEIMAADQESLIGFYNLLFGWETEEDREGFAYIHFPPSPPAHYPLLGGIGQAKPGSATVSLASALNARPLGDLD